MNLKIKNFQILVSFSFKTTTQTPTQKLKSGFLMFSSQEIGSSSVSLEIIFQALQSELFRFKFFFAGLKNPKNPGIQPMHK